MRDAANHGKRATTARRPPGRTISPVESVRLRTLDVSRLGEQVWEEEGNAELQKLSGNTRVPTIQVGSSVFSGFERSSYDSLLDSAGYPRAGVLPSRSQAAPGRPEGYVPPEEREIPKAEPVKPEPKPEPGGPYAPR